MGPAAVLPLPIPAARRPPPAASWPMGVAREKRSGAAGTHYPSSAGAVASITGPAPACICWMKTHNAPCSLRVESTRIVGLPTRYSKRKRMARHSPRRAEATMSWAMASRSASVAARRNAAMAVSSRLRGGRPMPAASWLPGANFPFAWRSGDGGLGGLLRSRP